MNLNRFLNADHFRTWLLALTVTGFSLTMTACGGETQTGPDLPPLPEQEEQKEQEEDKNDDGDETGDDNDTDEDNETGDDNEADDDNETGDDNSADTEAAPLYMIGDATPSGWSLDNKEALEPQGDDAAVYQWQGELSAGEIKFANYEATDFCGGAWLLASSEAEALELNGNGNAYVRAEDCTDESGVPDFKWDVETAGLYEIKVNTDEERVYFALEEEADTTPEEPTEDEPTPEEPVENALHLFLVGDATPGSWDLANATKMDRGTEDTYHYTVTVELSSGNFKIAMAESASDVSFDTGEDWIHPNTDGQPLAETAYSIVTSGEGTDYQWQISEGEVGTYDIEVHLEEETILIDKQ